MLTSVRRYELCKRGYKRHKELDQILFAKIQDVSEVAKIQDVSETAKIVDVNRFTKARCKRIRKKTE